MVVLSLFDGIAVANLALKRAGIAVDKYYSSEVDTKAIQVALANHPDIIQLGDVKQINGAGLGPIDLLIGGSPCQDLSSLGKQQGLAGAKSGLFYEYVRLLNEVKPKYFILENVASMKVADRDVISQILGVEPLLINSALVSAQCRKRLYWTNIPNVGQPNDKGIKLQDILSNGYADRDKAHTVLTNPLPQTITGLKRYLYKCTGQLAYKDKWFAELDKETKAERFANHLRLNKKKENNGSYRNNGVFRTFNINEIEALQTLPKDYTAGIPISDRHRCIGNSFTADVIAHILSHIA